MAEQKSDLELACIIASGLLASGHFSFGSVEDDDPFALTTDVSTEAFRVLASLKDELSESLPANATPDALGASRPNQRAEDGTLNIKPQDPLTGGALAGAPGEVATFRKGPALAADKAESISLQTGSLREPLALNGSGVDLVLGGTDNQGINSQAAAIP